MGPGKGDWETVEENAFHAVLPADACDQALRCDLLVISLSAWYLLVRGVLTSVSRCVPLLWTACCGSNWRHREECVNDGRTYCDDGVSAFSQCLAMLERRDRNSAAHHGPLTAVGSR